MTTSYPSPHSPKTSKAPGKRAAIYCRVSTDEQARHGMSLTTQLQGCQGYATLQGLSVVMVEQEDYTGTLLFERQGLQRVLSAVMAGAVDVVICYDLDRLTRDPGHLGYIETIVKHHGVGQGNRI